MAWDALQRRFQPDEDNPVSEQSRAVGASGGGASSGFSSNTQAGFDQGNAGSGGAPVSAGFVNYGTLFDANKEKAQKMAQDTYRGAESKAEAAKGNLQNAQNTFNQQKGWGSAGGPIGGPHGTRIEDTSKSQGKQQAGMGGEFKKYTYGTETGEELSGEKNKEGEYIDPVTTGQVKDGSYSPLSVPGQQGATGSTTAGSYRMAGGDPNATQSEGDGLRGYGGTASRYQGLFGPSGAIIGKPDESGLADYHHTTNALDAKSHAGGGYTGPDSLKDAIGEEAYAGLGKELSDAEAGAKALTTSGGIADALGYSGAEGTGLSALDTGLTQTAGQAAFKRLADRYGGLGKKLAEAQTNSMADAGRADAASQVSAAQWQKMVDDYEAANAPKPEAQSTYSSNGNNFKATDSDGKATNAAKTLGDSGYTMSELEEIYGDLTPEERAWLNGTSADGNVAGQLFNVITGESESNASIQQNVLAKLSKHRASKKG